mgnify:CR=1 FL=1
MQGFPNFEMRHFLTSRTNQTIAQFYYRPGGGIRYQLDQRHALFPLGDQLVKIVLYNTLEGRSCGFCFRG